MIYFANNLFPICTLYLLKLEVLASPPQSLSLFFDRCAILEAFSSDECY